MVKIDESLAWFIRALSEIGELPDLREEIYENWNLPAARPEPRKNINEINRIMACNGLQLSNLKEKILLERPHRCPVCYLQHRLEAEADDCCIMKMVDSREMAMTDEEKAEIAKLVFDGYSITEIHRAKPDWLLSLIHYHYGEVKRKIKREYKISERRWRSFLKHRRHDTGLDDLD